MSEAATHVLSPIFRYGAVVPDGDEYLGWRGRQEGRDPAYNLELVHTFAEPAAGIQETPVAPNYLAAEHEG